ncbi:MAG: S24/S26 family peptidase [Acidobacteriota bacterium]
MKIVKLWFGLVILARVVGDSMSPTIAPGAIVLACRLMSKPRIGDVVLAQTDMHTIIKRVVHIDEANGYYYLGREEAYGWLPLSAINARVVATWQSQCSWRWM